MASRKNCWNLTLTKYEANPSILKCVPTMKIFTVRIPTIFLTYQGAMAFLVLLIVFFRDQDFETLPSYLFKLIAVYRFNEASFVAGFILIVSMIIYFVIDNFNYNGKSAIKT